MWPAITLLIVSVSSQVNDLSDLPLPEYSDPPLAAVNPEVTSPGVDKPVADSNVWTAGEYYGEPFLSRWLAGPCVFNSIWDVTGGMSPTDWIRGYGPECQKATARLEWLLWFSRGRNAPVLARFTDTAGKTKDYPSEPIGLDMRNGARITLGRLLADEMTWAEGRFWGLEDGSETFAVRSPANVPIISRPIIIGATGQTFPFPVAGPGVSGSIHVLSKNDLIGADAWLRRTWWDDGYHRLDLLAGYQFTRMDDSLSIQTSSTFPAGSLNQQDLFRTQNEFHAGTIGFVFQHRKHWLSLETLGKIGFGNMREAVFISGRSTTTPSGGAPITTNRGFLAAPSNIGSHQRNRFAVAPELNLNAVVHFSPQWQFIAGYSIIYWSNAVLAGNQIDTQVGSTAMGPTHPLFTLNRSDFLVQGINLGAEYRW